LRGYFGRNRRKNGAGYKIINHETFGFDHVF
jgi:hypothetical protein